MPASTSTKYLGYPQLLGQKRISIIDRTGPASYVNGTGETISPKDFGFNNLESIRGGIDSTGTYMAVVYKNAGVVGAPSTFTLKWYTLSGMTEVANLTNLSAVTAVLVAIGF